jgi:predicted N-acetyltransferase YhbS
MSAIEDLAVRRATAADLPAVLELARRALGWTDDDTSFLEWRHLRNPFGASPMWIARRGDQVVGFRAFMRWDLVARGRVVRAARAVDTATDPDLQGQGVSAHLTRHGIAELPAEGVALVFGTPDEASRADYLEMGWEDVGRLGVSVRPHSGRFPRVVRTARRPASRQPVPTDVGDDPNDVFGQDEAVQALLEQLAPAGDGGQWTTRRTPAFLAWRYGLPELGYRALLRGPSPADGLVVFRRRTRGRAVETVIDDVLLPDGPGVAKVEEQLIDRVATAAASDYLLRLDQRRVTRGPFVRLPRVGPVLVCRTLDGSPPPGLSAWGLTMGDVELF